MSRPFEISRACYGARGARAILLRQIEAALTRLPRAHATDEQIHQARRYMKAARATLRLLRPALAERAYRAQNRTLRDAARDLGAVRDGPVLMKTLDRVVRKSRRAERQPAIEEFAAQLQRRAASDRISGRRTGIPAAAAKLRTALARVASWPPPGKGWRLVRKGLRQTYRKGRHAAKANGASPTSASLHEWRKRAKYLRNQLEVITPVEHASLSAMLEELHSLTHRLGEDHDLAVLSDLVRQHGPPLDNDSGSSLLGVIQQRRKKLQKKAVATGTALFAAKPAHFDARLRRYFRHWPG